jgi:hypothetical protein
MSRLASSALLADSTSNRPEHCRRGPETPQRRHSRWSLANMTRQYPTPIAFRAHEEDGAPRALLHWLPLTGAQGLYKGVRRTPSPR